MMLPCASPKISIFISRSCGKGRDGYSCRMHTICTPLVGLVRFLLTSTHFGKVPSNVHSLFLTIRLLQKTRSLPLHWSVECGKAKIFWSTTPYGVWCGTTVLLILPSSSLSNHPVFR